MILALLYLAAGIDTDLIRQCPKSDRIWAAQLGAWLVISFLLVFIICVHSIRFVPMIENDVAGRVAVALLVASTIFLFDRALYQSDWFFQRQLKESGSTSDQAGSWHGRQAGRLILRLGISLLVAFQLSVFLELSIFSEAIKDRLEEKNSAANALTINRIEAFRKEQDTDLASQKAAIQAEEKEVVKTMEAIHLAAQLSADPRLPELGKEIDRLEGEQKRISEGIARKQLEISERNLEVVAETEGTQLDHSYPSRFSGVPNCGPRCRSAKKLIALSEAELASKEKEFTATRDELAQLHTKRDAVLTELRDEASRSQQTLEHRRNELKADLEIRRTRFASAQEAMPARLKAYQDVVGHALGYAALRSDLLLQLRALQELKADAEYGPTITLYSLSLKLFLIFLEIVPVLGKIFFAPPTAYSLRLQSKIRDHQKIDVPATGEDVTALFDSANDRFGRSQGGAHDFPTRGEIQGHLTICG